MTEILVLFHSCFGNTRAMARYIAQGIQEVEGVFPRIRVPAPIENSRFSHPEEYPTVSIDDFAECQGLAMGSPTHFGNMSATMKACIDQTTPLWLKGSLEGKPATVFTSTASMHTGHETTLLSMMIPLLHLGMIIVGVPSSEKALIQTTTGGTPYGASHLSGANSKNPISAEEKILCITQGKRLAEIVKKLSGV